MRKIIASEFVSLDGVIETPSWSIQLTGEEQQKYKLDELSASDALLLGRATYEELAASWPHESEQYGGYTDMMNSYPKYVVSTTLQEPLEWKASLIEGDVAEEVLRLKQEPGKDILVYGSGDLVNTLMQHNLLDEYRLMVFPVVVGSGKRLFEDGGDQIALELVDSKTFSTGVVYLTYRPASERDDNDQKEIEAGNTRERTTLVLGGTGKTGRRVVERLRARGASVRVGSRSGKPPFDWEDRDTWAPALGDVGAVYVSYYPDLAVPGAVETVGSFADLAVASGVRRLVLLAGRGEPEAEEAEDAVRESGAELTIVRSTWFAQNFSEDYWAEGILNGELALPAGEVPEPFVDADDIADVAVAALTEDGHAGELYELTGPRLLTFAEAIDEIAKAAGREIRFVPVSIDEFASEAVEQGAPGEMISLLRRLFGEVLDGRNAHLTDGVRRALGREPKDFRDYAREAASTGVWGNARDGKP